MDARSKTYKVNHILAKVIICCIILILEYFEGILSPLILIVTVLFFFGVNTVAYILEAVEKRGHDHDKI